MPIKPVRLVKCISGSEPEYDSISAPSTVIDGELLVKTNNAGVVCASAAAVATYFSQISGTSTVPGTSTLTLGKLRAGDTFEMNSFHPTGGASSTVADADLDGQADFGITFVTVSSVAAWVIDRFNTTQKVVRIIENTEVASAHYPRCRVQFLPAAITFA